MGASWSASWRWTGHGAPRPSTQPCPSTVTSTEPTSSGAQGTRGDPHGAPLVDVMPALGCQPRSNGLRRAVTPGPSQRQDGPPSLLTRPSGCWASRGCGLPGRVPRSGTNPGSPELGRVGGQAPVPAHSRESVRVRGVHSPWRPLSSPWRPLSVASTPAHTNCTHFRPVDCLRPAKALLRAAPPAGFEPATRRLEGGRSNPLSYGGLSSTVAERAAELVS